MEYSLRIISPGFFCSQMNWSSKNFNVYIKLNRYIRGNNLMEHLLSCPWKLSIVPFLKCRADFRNRCTSYAFLFSLKMCVESFTYLLEFIRLSTYQKPPSPCRTLSPCPKQNKTKQNLCWHQSNHFWKDSDGSFSLQPL